MLLDLLIIVLWYLYFRQGWYNVEFMKLNTSKTVLFLKQTFWFRSINFAKLF